MGKQLGKPEITALAGQIRAGTELPSRTRQDQDSNSEIGFHRIQYTQEIPSQFGYDAISVFRTIESDTNDAVGDPLEMFFTLPSELTGRGAESVKCDARVVHVDSHANGSVGVGAVIERFEALERVRSWAN